MKIQTLDIKAFVQVILQPYGILCSGRKMLKIIQGCHSMSLLKFYMKDSDGLRFIIYTKDINQIIRVASLNIHFFSWFKCELSCLFKKKKKRFSNSI